MEDLKERLQIVMDAMGWERRDLVRVSGESSSVVSQWLGRGSKVIKTIGKMEAATAIAEETGFTALWIAKGIGPRRTDTGQKRRLIRVANDMEKPLVTSAEDTLRLNPRPVFLWRELMQLGEWPERFDVRLDDDALSPLARRGELATFQTGIDPTPRDGVLVKDKQGKLYARRYRELTPGHWQAYPVNDAYSVLDSEQHGIRVLAVYLGVFRERKLSEEP